MLHEHEHVIYSVYKITLFSNWRSLTKKFPVNELFNLHCKVWRTIKSEMFPKFLQSLPVVPTVDKSFAKYI